MSKSCTLQNDYTKSSSFSPWFWYYAHDKFFLLNSWFICLNKFVPKYLFCTYTLPHLSSHWKSMYIAPLFKPLTRPQYVEVTDCINKQHTYRVKDWEILINGFWNPFVGLIFSSPSIYQDRNKSLNHVNWQIFCKCLHRNSVMEVSWLHRK